MNLKLRCKDKAIFLNNPKGVKKFFYDFWICYKNDSQSSSRKESGAKVTKFERMQNIRMKKMRIFLFPGY